MHSTSSLLEITGQRYDHLNLLLSYLLVEDCSWACEHAESESQNATHTWFWPWLISNTFTESRSFALTAATDVHRGEELVKNKKRLAKHILHVNNEKVTHRSAFFFSFCDSVADQENFAMVTATASQKKKQKKR